MVQYYNTHSAEEYLVPVLVCNLTYEICNMHTYTRAYVNSLTQDIFRSNLPHVRSSENSFDIMSGQIRRITLYKYIAVNVRPFFQMTDQVRDSLTFVRPCEKLS